MNGKCNTLSLNAAAVMQVLRKASEAGLQLEGKALMDIMRREVNGSSNGGAPGKPEWRNEIQHGIKQQDTRRSANSIEMDFGYQPSGESELVRAMIVTEGSGSAVGNPKIHAGPEGRSVWDDDVTGRHPSRSKSEYDLPEAFNQKGNQWVLNSLIMMDGRYLNQIEMVFGMLPDSVFYDNVNVSG